MGKCPKACPTFSLVVTLLLYPASVTLVRICPASRLWVGLPRGPSSRQQHSTQYPSRSASFCAVLDTSLRMGVRPGRRSHPAPLQSWCMVEGGMAGLLSSFHALPIPEAHIWIKDGVNNIRGFSPSSWVPQCLTEPGRTRDPHTPALLSTSSAFSSHRSRARPHSEEGPDFIYLSSSLALLEPSSSRRLRGCRIYVHWSSHSVNKQARQTLEKQAGEARQELCRGLSTGDAGSGCAICTNLYREPGGKLWARRAEESEGPGPQRG